MRVSNAHVVELAAVGVDHDYTRLTGLGGDVTQGLVRFALGDKYFIDTPADTQSLNNGVAALDNIVFYFIFCVSFVHFFTYKQ